MEVGQLQILQPAYYKKFHCIGGACEDNCCKDWRIDIDKNTYLLYKSIKTPAFQIRVSKGLKRVEAGKSRDAVYAQIIPNAQGLCPFLDAEGLCTIQKYCGAQYLSDTCKVYPRYVAYTQPGLVERALTTSCPEAVRVALFAEEPLIFELVEAEESDQFTLKNVSKSIPDEEHFGALAQYAWEIREACMDMMQSRNLTIPERLFAMGMLLDKLTRLPADEVKDKTIAMLNLYFDAAQAGQFHQALEQLPTNPDRRSGIYAHLMQFMMALDDPTKPVIQRFKAQIAEWMVGEQRQAVNYTEMLAHIDALSEKHWEPFLRERSHVVENYLVNLMFTKKIPFTLSELTVYHHVILLAEQYAMMRMLVSMNAEESGGVDDALLIAVIRELTIMSLHNTQANRLMQDYIQTKNDQLAHISFLLR